MDQSSILAIVGAIGVGALVMSLNEQKSNKKIREDFTMVGLKSKYIAGTDNNGTMSALNVLQYPNIKPLDSKSTGAKNQVVEKFASRTQDRSSVGLGGAMVTDQRSFPTVSQPNYQQSTPLRSASLGLPASIRYNPPSKNNMGLTENYDCKRTPVNIRENYIEKNTTPFMAPFSDPYQGPGYTAGGQVQLKKDPNVNYTPNDMAAIGTVEEPLGDGQPIMTYTRAMTAVMKPGRFRQKGVADMIRGDIPIAPANCNGWFQTPADPTALTTGALAVMGGNNETTNDMAKFMKMYGDATNVFGGVNFDEKPDMQYTSMDMKPMNNGLNSANLSVSSF